ncbi:Hypothetical predicted protein [Cloeon dipterum]|uniref:DUF4806 domain-containing protein n=1 Tax=Cloeon dipterum TaxID=197152 RepID=A0A8S1BNW8_9INSE|nr:Hypothetical predicted protein [Cloeon dipterum]
MNMHRFKGSQINVIRKIDDFEKEAKPIVGTTEDELGPRFKRPSVSLQDHSTFDSKTKRLRKPTGKNDSIISDVGSVEGIATRRASTKPHDAMEVNPVREVPKIQQQVHIANESLINANEKSFKKLSERVKFVGAQLDVLIKGQAEINIQLKQLNSKCDEILSFVSKKIDAPGFITVNELEKIGIILPLKSLNELNSLSQKLNSSNTLEVEDKLNEYVYSRLSGNNVRRVATSALRECLSLKLMSQLVLRHVKKTSTTTVAGKKKSVFSSFKLYNLIRDCILKYCRKRSITATVATIDTALSYRLAKSGVDAKEEAGQGEVEKAAEHQKANQNPAVYVADETAASASQRGWDGWDSDSSPPTPNLFDTSTEED